jgi:hypothetical protein
MSHLKNTQKHNTVIETYQNSRTHYNKTNHTKEKLSLCYSIIPWRCMGGMQVQLHTFLTSTLESGEWSALHSGCYTTHRERVPCTNWIRSSVCPRASLDAMEKQKNLTPARNWILSQHTHARARTHTQVSSHVCTSHCLVVASNGRRSPSSGFPNYSQTHLQQILTHSLTNRLLFTSFN